MNKKTIKDIEWQGKKALVRVDFNVPLSDVTLRMMRALWRPCPPSII